MMTNKTQLLRSTTKHMSKRMEDEIRAAVRAAIKVGTLLPDSRKRRNVRQTEGKR